MATSHSGIGEDISTSPRRWVALTVLLLGLAMAPMDITNVNLTLPSISAGLAASPSTLSWVVSGYVLAYALTLIPAGRLGDRYGHKWVFLSGVALFVITGVFASLAQTEIFLIVARVLHGVAGGLLVPPTTALIPVLFTGLDRVRAFGFWAAVTGVASAVGPVLAGWAIDVAGIERGWRFALAVGLPLGILALVLAVPVLPSTKARRGSRFDFVGLGLLSVALTAILIPLIQTQGGALPAWTIPSVIAAVVTVVALVIWERHLERRKSFPLLPTSLFRPVSFSFGLLTAVVGFAAFTSSIYIAMSVAWQSGREESALATALVVLPFGIGCIVGPTIGDRLAVWWGRWVVSFTLLILVLGFGSTYIALRVSPLVDELVLVVPLFAAGAGTGAFIGLNMASILTPVSEENAGVASGMVITGQSIGSALGAALVLIIVSKPGPGGVMDADTYLNAGIRGVLMCAVMAAMTFVLSIVVALRSTSKEILTEVPESHAISSIETQQSR